MPDSGHNRAARRREAARAQRNLLERVARVNPTDARKVSLVVLDVRRWLLAHPTENGVKPKLEKPADQQG